MNEGAKKTEWLCISCGKVLGHVLGGELTPEVAGCSQIRTRGPNLVVTCAQCGAEKCWYTADPIVRALYQLIDAIASQAAKRMVVTASQQMLGKSKVD